MVLKIKKELKAIPLSEVPFLREDIIDGIFNCNWYGETKVLMLSICRLHEIGYRKIGHFDTAIKWQINAEKILKNDDE